MIVRRFGVLAVMAGLVVVVAPSSASAFSRPEGPPTAPVTVEQQDQLDDDGGTEPSDTEPEDPSTPPPVTTTPDGTAPEADRDPSEDTVRPAASPQVRSSAIPRGSIALAALVLVLVAGLSVIVPRRRTEEPSARPGPPPDRAGETATLDFLLELGRALVDAGDAVSHVEATLRQIARVNGIEELGVLVLPTALVVSVPGSGGVTTEVGTAGRAGLRLDQVDDVLRLVHEAESGRIGADEGRRQLARIRASAHPYPTLVVLAGYTLSTVGLAAILNAGWQELVVSIVLGLAIGCFRQATRGLGATYQPFIPLLAATAVSTAVFLAARIVDDLITFPLLVSPLIFFLPGAALTMATLELVTGHVVSGVARLAAGGMQLVLLALGMVAGAELVGLPAGDLRSMPDGALAVLIPWIGVAVFGVGVAWFSGARREAQIWILAVVYVAYSGQVIGGLFFGSSLSAFFGAAAMTPVAVLASRQRAGPTPLVTFLPGFWILVPGALGLEGVSRVIGDGGLGSGVLVTTLTSMIGISLGILLGLIVATRDPERPWAASRVPG